MNKGKLCWNFYTAGRNNELKETLTLKADVYKDGGNETKFNIPAASNLDSFFLIGYKYDATGAAVKVICGILSKTWESVGKYMSIYGDSPNSVSFNKTTRQYEVYVSGYSLMLAIKLK